MTTAHRRFVRVLLALLVVPGVIGFELWPLTGWRLFSLARTERQTVWVLEAEGEGGDSTQVDFEQLAYRYRLAEYLLADLPDAGQRRRDEVCLALLDATIAVVDDVRTLRLLRDQQRLRRTDRGAVVEHDPSVFHSCERPS